MEFAGFRPLLQSFREMDWSIQFAACGIWKEKKVTLVAEGPGPALALRALNAALSHDRFESVVSTGFCGGLDPALPVGAVLAASDVRDPRTGRRYLTSLPKARELETGSIVSVDRVAVSSAEKAELRSTGARAVEMEAAALADYAAQAGVDFYCIRVVSDTAAETLPLDFNAYRDAEGRFDRGRIAMAALARPVHRIPGLMRLQRNCRLAASRLGEFFAHCSL